ncbi:hypothetical protein EI555_014721 [Monodon monoceros]|uniref:Uncharacterized protein n=1 Tax=Monodon monoceros TaxID=40151 RepID=A0A4U1EVL0_MONMO|nr:hypothetical protein EI555_014721 [Monodon monoceros]
MGAPERAEALAPLHARGLRPKLRVKRVFFLNETASFVRSFVCSGSCAAGKQQTSAGAPAVFAAHPDVPPQCLEAPPAQSGLPEPPPVRLFLTLRETPNALRKIQ